jgi:hypothetical protein
LVVDALRAAGARVEAIASFVPQELRGVNDFTRAPVREVFFFHSAGDVQKACHNGMLQEGDVVFFNAGSLIWERSQEGYLSWIAKGLFADFDREQYKMGYKLQSYADFNESANDEAGMPHYTSSTLLDYKRRYKLSIGLYCQEFAIDEVAVEFLVKYTNRNLDVFDLGMSWGGVNGVTVKGIQPGRFTNTDGFWNQRYLGASWDSKLWPENEIRETN